MGQAGIKRAAARAALRGGIGLGRRRDQGATDEELVFSSDRTVSGAERDPPADWEDRALLLAAALSITDVAAVADPCPTLRAEPPDSVLDEPREVGGEVEIELPGIDLSGDPIDDPLAPAVTVAGGAVLVLGPEPIEDARSAQKVVHERVDRDHRRSRLDPAQSARIAPDQEVGEGHVQHLSGYPENLDQLVHERPAHQGLPIGMTWSVGALEQPINEANEIPARPVA